MNYELTNGGLFLLGVTMRTRMLPVEAVQAPDDYLKMDNEAELNAWLEAVDLQKLLQNLRQAGVPEELMELVEWYLTA